VNIPIYSEGRQAESTNMAVTGVLSTTGEMRPN